MYDYWGTIHNSKDMEPTQMPIDERPDKENVVPIMEYYAAIKKEWDVFCGNMDGARGHYP